MKGLNTAAESTHGPASHPAALESERSRWLNRAVACLALLTRHAAHMHPAISSMMQAKQSSVRMGSGCNQRGERRHMVGLER